MKASARERFGRMGYPLFVRAWLTFCACCLLLAVVPRSSGAWDFYVRENGNDERDGFSPESAFATIGRGAEALDNANDRVIVGPGTYREGNITPGRNGIEGHPVVFLADQNGTLTGDAPGAVVVSPPVEQTAGFLLLGHRYVVIDGFTITGAGEIGIQVRSLRNGEHSAHVVIRNMEILDSGKRGIDISAEARVVLEGNLVRGSGSAGITMAGVGPDAEPLFPVVSGNTLHANGADGLLVLDTRAGVIQNNVIVSNGAAGLTVRGAIDLLIGNNLVYDNAEEGIGVGTGDSGCLNTQVVGNTVFGNGGWGLAVGSALDGSPGATVLDNIFSMNAQGGIAVTAASADAYAAGFNIVHPQTYGPKTPWNSYDLHTVPLFVDPDGADGVLGGDGFADDDFRLIQGGAETSAGVDGGSTTVELRGVTGSTSVSGEADVGIVDVGFHYGATSDQVLEVELPLMPLFVRMDGNDEHLGKSPDMALGSIAEAAERARAGISVIVGPGRYAEGDVNPPQRRGRMAFVADPAGIMTGDDPGVVYLDAGGAETGFTLLNAAYGVVDGFYVTGAEKAGIQVRSGSDHACIRNNTAFSNLHLGIDVQDAEDVKVENNLVYDNGSGGIQTGGTVLPSARAMILNNTCYRNGANGITIGAGAPSPCARVWYNAVHKNVENGIQVGSYGRSEESLPGYDPGYNVNTDGYGTDTPRPDSDLALDPLFVDPNGLDGVLGGDGFEDDMFQLQQVAAGQEWNGPGVGFAPVLAEDSGLGDRTTRSDGVSDDAYLDIGYHYRNADTALNFFNSDRPTAPGEGEFAEFCYEDPVHPLIGDCNGDGTVTVDEIVTAVNITLGETDVSVCPAADGNDDGTVTVNELVAIVVAALSV